MYNIIAIGDCVIDTHVQIDEAVLDCELKEHPCYLCLEFASKIPIKDSFQSLGGNAANLVVGATKLGMKTAIVSSIGDDSNGRMIIEELNKFKIDTQFINIETKSSTRYSLVLNYKSDRTILSFHGQRKYVWPKNLPLSEWIYYTGLSSGFKKLKKPMLNWLKKNPSVRLAFNPGSYQLKNHLDQVIETVSKSDVLIINLEEAQKIVGFNKEEKSPVKIIKNLLKMGAKEAVITDADHGAYVGDINEIWHMESFPVKVVAKTGAGDAFSSGYLSARVEGYNRPQALRWGIANSCGVISEVGAQKGLLDKKHLQKMLDKYIVIKPSLLF